MRVLVCLALLLYTSCASRFVGYHVEGVVCGYNQLDPDAETIRTMAQIAGSAMQSAAEAPSMPQAVPTPSALPSECTQAETCVYFSTDPQTRAQTCIVIRGGQTP